MNADLLVQLAIGAGSALATVAVLKERLANLAREVERVDQDAKRESERQDKAISAAFKRIDELRDGKRG